jgi:effector-binding domain-containing protein
MKTLRYLLCLALALSLVGLGCPKEEGAAPEGEEAAKGEPAKEEAKGEPAKEEAKEEAAAEPAVKLDPEVAQILDAAIEAMGGAEKIKAIEGWTAKSKGTYMGMPYTSSDTGKPGVMRMDIEMPGGEKMPMVQGLEQCWSKSGPVVIPCCEEGKAQARTMTAMDMAMMLLPLKTQPGWEIEAGESSLKVKNEEYGAEGTLTFDPETKLLVGMNYKGKMHKQEGEFATKYSDYKEFCGIKFPSKMDISFAGKPWLKEEWTEMTCGPVDDGLFEQPEQVADGTFVEKTTQPMAMACLQHKGPYEKLNDTTKKLMGMMGKQKMKPMGPMMMTYLKGPPKVKKPKQFVTEICIPVAAKPPKKPQKKGKLTLKGMKPMSVLAVYGSGDYQKKSPELMKALVDEAKKRKLKTEGPVCGIYYMDPAKTPAEQLVSEMMIPVKGGKKPPKKAGKAMKMQKKKVIKPIKKNP